MDRRGFLKLAGAAGGIAVAGALGYEGLSLSTRGPPSTQTNSTTIGGSTLSSRLVTSNPSSQSAATNPSDYTSDYAEFMGWLRDASKPYKGIALNISMESEPFYVALQQRDPDFYLTTGINVQYNIQPYQFQLSTINLAVNTRSPSYDAFTVDHQDVAEFKDHILSPVQLAEKYPGITYEKLYSRDFFALPWSLLAVYPPDLTYNYGPPAGDVYFIPGNSPTTIQFFRNDLLNSQGLTPAKTWDDYLTNVQTLNNTSQSRFGCVDMAGFSVYIIEEFLNHLKSFGGDLWEINGNQLTSGLGSDAALAALENLLRFEPYSDVSSSTFIQDDITQQLSLGNAANALQFGDYAYYEDDPFRSNIPGKLGFAPNPSGPNGSFSTWSGGGLGVSKYSRNPEAAWLWLQWATSLGLQEMLSLGSFHPFPSRKGALANSQVQDVMRTASGRSLPVVNEVWNASQVTSLVPFPQWPACLQFIATYLNDAWRGLQSPKQALELTTQKLATLGTLTF